MCAVRPQRYEEAQDDQESKLKIAAIVSQRNPPYGEVAYFASYSQPRVCAEAASFLPIFSDSFLLNGAKSR